MKNLVKHKISFKILLDESGRVYMVFADPDSGIHTKTTEIVGEEEKYFQTQIEDKLTLSAIAVPKAFKEMFQGPERAMLMKDTILVNG